MGCDLHDTLTPRDTVSAVRWPSRSPNTQELLRSTPRGGQLVAFASTTQESPPHRLLQERGNPTSFKSKGGVLRGQLAVHGRLPGWEGLSSPPENVRHEGLAAPELSHGDFRPLASRAPCSDPAIFERMRLESGLHVND